MRLIDAVALKETINAHDYVLKDCLNTTDKGMFTVGIMQAIDAQPTVERDVPKRVLWTGWKGYRDTRYKCPCCKKPVRNDDVYCHKCGQHLMFPKIDFTPYVEGQKQELIVRWDDETD